MLAITRTKLAASPCLHRRRVVLTRSSLYQLLDVESGCPAPAVKAAFRRLAALHHPDMNPAPDAAAHYQAIVEAYTVLRDVATRKKYDEQGLAGLGPRFSHLKHYVKQQEAAEGAASSSAPLAPGLEEVGREGWAPGRQRGIRARGRDVVAVLGLELREAVTGVEKLVSTCILGTCLACQGWGSDTSSSPASADWQRGVQLCEVCRGSGEILKTVWQPSGMRVGKLDTCPACSGRGTQPLPPCKKCGGEGRIRTRRRVAVRVPAGVTQRSRLRLPGLGDAGRAGGEAGDLMLRFHVHMSDDMERRGLDMHTRLPLSLWDALLGTSLEVATARGLRILDVPPGVQHGDTLQMQHAGVANSERGVMSYGHHYFELHLVVPDSASLTPDALTALDELRRLREKHQHSEGEAGAAEASAVGRS
ncbi:hypothetical protein V8C86DRAFT_2510935 [Haematococcus lacustris]